jgi:hypothetical protein
MNCFPQTSGGALVLRCIALLLILLLGGHKALGYSVLTHEEIVDLLWLDEIRPLLLKKYPALTEEQTKEAHAYAYGGAVIQDLGYYPFGSEEFSDLVHYVRSGDFVLEMLKDSQDANEYAFALGALAHYTSDITGHPAVNHAVAIEYPKLRAKFGDSVRYAQDKTAHLRTEFGFDTVQVAKKRYAPESYHDFIGFRVSKPLLERAFPVVYGVELKEILTHEDLAVGTYRWAVSGLIPQMTQVALKAHKKEFVKEHPNFAKKQFLYHLSRASYEKEWGKDYTRPGFGIRFLAAILRLMPKVGPFKGLAFNSPTAQTEDLYIKSIDATVGEYRKFLQQERAGTLKLPNVDFDTGQPTRPLEYPLTDSAYGKLLTQLSKRNFAGTSPELRANILDFYSNLSVFDKTKHEQDDWNDLLTALERLKSLAPTPPAVTLAQ